MTYTTYKDETLSEIRGCEVFKYICDGCGEQVDCNANFDKTANPNFCDNCGEKLTK